jgi:hypothetical protein
MSEIEEKNPVEEAKQLLERIQEENRISKQLLEKAAELKAEQILSGQSTAGQAPPAPVDPQEAIRERVNKLLEGIGKKI